ncbi:TMhelix containing protein [Vibrio phage 1.055.O._10N.286.55.E9]|nr:TMhelix containing protein [Vibrio phage 1.055.O._10N.286.55.E9]
MANVIDNLGKTGTDLVTGFSGIITGVASYITGCDQYSLMGKASGDSTGNTIWVDVNRIAIDENVCQLILNTDVDKGACESPSKS